MIRSSIVALSAYLYTPGTLTAPFTDNVYSSCKSNIEGIYNSSFFCKGRLAAEPLNIPVTLRATTSWVKSGFWRNNTARLTKASSVIPSAFSINSFTVVTFPKSYNPGRYTAPRIWTRFSKRFNIGSTEIKSPSTKGKLLNSPSSTLYTWYSRPLFRITRIAFL